jgi:phage I-like protein
MKFKKHMKQIQVFRTEVNVNPKNDEKRMKENLQKLHVQKNHTLFLGNLLCQ